MKKQSVKPFFQCGVDEVGRGALAGPVIAAAVILPEQFPVSVLSQLQDSKRLSKKTRLILAQHIFQQAIVTIGQADVHEIDTLNILQASLKAMQRAIETLPRAPEKALIDGKYIPPFLKCCDAVPIIQGDTSVPSIAAASIVAKVTRDQIMSELALLYPQFGWEYNSGYPTAKHKNALKIYGTTPQHRQSFSPVRQAARRHNSMPEHNTP